MSFRLTGELICVSIRRTVAHTLNVILKGGVKQSCRESEVVSVHCCVRCYSLALRLRITRPGGGVLK